MRAHRGEVKATITTCRVKSQLLNEDSCLRSLIIGLRHCGCYEWSNLMSSNNSIYTIPGMGVSVRMHCNNKLEVNGRPIYAKELKTKEPRLPEIRLQTMPNCSRKLSYFGLQHLLSVQGVEQESRDEIIQILCELKCITVTWSCVRIVHTTSICSDTALTLLDIPGVQYSMPAMQHRSIHIKTCLRLTYWAVSFDLVLSCSWALPSARTDFDTRGQGKSS